MRIGISTSVIGRGKTGIATYVFGLVRSCQQYGKRHRFILFVLEQDVPLFGYAKEFADIVTVPERYRDPAHDILWHQTHLPRLARELGLDVVHVPSYRRMLWPRVCGLVTTIHDLAPFQVPKKYDLKRMLYAQFVARVLARRQHEIIAVSHNTARDIGKFFNVPKEHVTVIHNGIDHSRFVPGKPEKARLEVANRYGLDKPFFLYVARLEHPAKNHVRLIEAFDRFKTHTRYDWQLVLAGGDWHGAEEIHAAANRSMFSQDIRSLGFVLDAELPSLYRAANVLVYPSLYEGFGLPPLEAMACGCPVISSPSGSLAEVVGDAAIQVEATDVCGWKDQMVRLAQDETLRTQYRAAGLERAKKFDWNLCASATLKVYSRAARAAFGCQPLGVAIETLLRP